MAISAHDYLAIAREAQRQDTRTVIAYLDQILPFLWQADYEAQAPATSNLLTITFGGRRPGEPFCRYLFDQASASSGTSLVEDRVVAAWGISRHVPAASRNRSRMHGFLRSVWSTVYPGADRGHFLAHTLGGGLDINLFPQSKRVNRSGLWRQMETYCSRNPGTFYFVRPLYQNGSWIPSELEFGIFKTVSPDPSEYWGHVFVNDMLSDKA
ncbi:MAG: hypothetical protein WDN01_02980 [Rhizomicrobium sp.]